MGIGIMIGHMVAVPLVQVDVPVATNDATCTKELDPALWHCFLIVGLLLVRSPFLVITSMWWTFSLTCVVTPIFFCTRVWSWPEIYSMDGCILLLGSLRTRIKCAMP